jgi:hypothetical protein
VDASTIDPLEANGAGGYLWADRVEGPQLDAQLFEQLDRKASVRTVYDVAHPPPWGAKVSAYLFTKSLASGVFLASALLLPPLSLGSGIGTVAAAWTAALANSTVSGNSGSDTGGIYSTGEGPLTLTGWRFGSPAQIRAPARSRCSS